MRYIDACPDKVNEVKPHCSVKPHSNRDRFKVLRCLLLQSVEITGQNRVGRVYA